MEAAHNDTTTVPDWWQPKTPRPQNVFLTSFLSLLLSFTIVMDLVGNSFVIAAVTKNDRLRNLGMDSSYTPLSPESYMAHTSY